jgi:hypothetical protein
MDCVQEVMGHLEKVREERAQDKQAKQEKAQVGTLHILLLTAAYHIYRLVWDKICKVAFHKFCMLHLYCSDPDYSVLS